MKTDDLMPDEQLVEWLDGIEFRKSFASGLADQGVVSKEQFEQLCFGLSTEDKLDGELDNGDSATQGQDPENIYASLSVGELIKSTHIPRSLWQG